MYIYIYNGIYLWNCIMELYNKYHWIMGTSPNILGISWLMVGNMVEMYNGIYIKYMMRYI